MYAADADLAPGLQVELTPEETSAIRNAAEVWLRSNDDDGKSKEVRCLQQAYLAIRKAEGVSGQAQERKKKVSCRLSRGKLVFASAFHV